MKRDKGDESAPLPFLSCDLIFLILIWLPVKSILRFKCVCKSWFTLFTDPDFVNEHLSQSLTSKLIVSCLSSTSCPTLLVVPTCGTDGENRDPRPIHHIETRGTKFNILGSCDGLVLYGTGPFDWRHSDRLCLLNPSTGKQNILPVLPLSIEKIIASDWAYDSYGFGYDESIDDYKVVVITSSPIDRVFGYPRPITYVYTLKTNYWRRTQDIPSCIRLPLKASGILLHGVLHWLDAYDRMIICFDLVEEKFRLLSLPAGLLDDDPRDAGYSTLEVLRGCLCISCLKWERDCLPCREYWVMKEYGKNDWSSMTCDINKSLDDFSNSDKEELFSFEKRWLVGYNVEKDSYCRYHLSDCDSDTVWQLEIYLETIVSPYHVP